MPFKFTTTPASQVKPTQPAKKGRPVSVKKPPLQRKTQVVVAAYGGKLFEPIMAREKPIKVEFVPWFSSDNVRFSVDGFFAIKYIQEGRRCYLFYFINPVNVREELTLSLACQEAIDYETYEFEDDDDYRKASLTIDHEWIRKNQDKSCLGKVKLKLIEILRNHLIAETFLKKQRLMAQQDNDWQDYLKKKEKLEKEEEANADLDESGAAMSVAEPEPEATTQSSEVAESREVQVEAKEEVNPVEFRPSKGSQSGGTKTPTFVWGKQS